MARYRGSVCKLCRRENVKLFLKGDRCLSDKCSFERRAYPPGQHGQRRTKLSDFGLQLREKQKLKRVYSMSESQFRRNFFAANSQKGATGDNMLKGLELRLDNVIHKMGFADCRTEARHLIRHGHFKLNGRKVNVPSIVTSPNDEVSVVEKSQKKTPILRALQNVGKREVPDWLELDAGNFKGKVKTIPERHHISLPIEENLVVELYSR